MIFKMTLLFGYLIDLTEYFGILFNLGTFCRISYAVFIIHKARKLHLSESCRITSHNSDNTGICFKAKGMHGGVSNLR